MEIGEEKLNEEKLYQEDNVNHIGRGNTNAISSEQGTS